MTRTLPLRSALVVLLAFLAVAPAASARPDSAARLQMVWPASGTVTAHFGEWRGSHRHAGIDIGMLRTLRLRSVLAGTVERTGYVSGYDGYGQVVVARSARPVHGALRAPLVRARPIRPARPQRAAARARRLHGELLGHAPPLRDRAARRAGRSAPLPRLGAPELDYRGRRCGRVTSSTAPRWSPSHSSSAGFSRSRRRA